MHITLFQYDITWADKHANFRKIEDLLKQPTVKTDLLVLPEMFSTGFCVENPELAETMTDETVKILQNWAVTYQIAITGSFVATDGTCNYNRGFFVFPNAHIVTADKRHLFGVGGESKYFKQGDKKLLVHYKGFNIQLLICYDLRFPVWSRNVNNSYDLLIYVANFPSSRIYNWDVLLKARAIENQCFVCGVNRIGTDGLGIDYNGHSVLVDYYGRVVSSCYENETQAISCVIHLDDLQRFREKSPFWKDADSFTLD